MKRLLVAACALLLAGTLAAKTVVKKEATPTEGKQTVSKASWTAYVTAKGQAKTSDDYAKVAALAPYPAGQAWAWYNAARLIVWTPDFKVIQGLTVEQKKTAAGYLGRCEGVMTETGYSNKDLSKYIQQVKDTLEGKK